ncbi:MULTISPECIES: helix-turn-helix transcriptional regulator [unclassified Streptomyces]|uniref:helix-turn-helix domain-containing protein n=1 Tax=unclassified Streptomyces TaxID=2593676 RepID=UPI002475DBF0|nr:MULTISPECIES: helix-turn-helix transcriptional regulator [unclassified Streptomyces]
MTTSNYRPRNELGEYLRARRAAIDPETAGLPRGRRRVPGLRREEVATLAGVSVDYYTRLEQGREKHPSPQLIHTLSRVLELSTDEQLHMYRLAGVDPTHSARDGNGASAPYLTDLMDRWAMNPAFVYDDTQEILAANALGRALHSPFKRADNFARMVFLDPAGPGFFVEWERVAIDTVGSLRQAWGKVNSRHSVETVVSELRSASAAFVRMWETHAVIGKNHQRKSINHPAVGPLTLDYVTFAIPDAHDHHLLVCDTPAGSSSERALELLGSLSAHFATHKGTGESVTEQP